MTSRSVGGPSYTLTYDAENRLTGVSGGASASFVYDGDGKRVLRIGPTGTTVTIGRDDEQTRNTIKKYYYASGQRVGSILYWLLTDHLGSTAKVASGSNPYGELRYKAFGATRFTSGPPPPALQPGRNNLQSSRTLTT